MEFNGVNFEDWLQRAKPKHYAQMLQMYDAGLLGWRRSMAMTFKTVLPWLDKNVTELRQVFPEFMEYLHREED